MTDYLNMAEVLAMHVDQIEHYGGSQGLRDHGLFEARSTDRRPGITPI